MSITKYSLIILSIMSSILCSMDSFIMMPFRTFDESGNLINKTKLNEWLTNIKESGFKGVTSDFWWNIVEPESKNYNFTPYIELAKEIQKMDLKLKVILSFHACGSTIGDECFFPLPGWVSKTGNHIFYQDQNGNINKEYISIFADDLQLSDGRPVLQAYQDLISEFNSTFQDFYGDLIVNIEIGVGPAGQLHYPSYSYKNAFCGVGFFQWYGSLAKQKFTEFLAEFKFENEESNLISKKIISLPSPTLKNVMNKPEQEYFFSELNINEKRCAVSEKTDCGHSKISQNECQAKGCCWQEVAGDPYCFYSREVYNYKADFGVVYMQWYQEEQLKHLQRVLTIARKILGFGVPLSLKLPCVHWMTDSKSRAAEKTAGFVSNQSQDVLEEEHEELDEQNIELLHSTFVPLFNTPERDSFKSFSDLVAFSKTVNSYSEIFKISSLFRSKLVFSCVELEDKQFDSVCQSAPQSLTNEIKDLSQKYSVSIIAENSETLNPSNVNHKLEIITNNLPGFFEFTYMRMNDFELPRDEFKEVKNQIVSKVSKIESTNFYNDEEMHWIEIVMTFDNPADAQNAMNELNNYMII